MKGVSKMMSLPGVQEICIIDDSPGPRSVTKKVCENRWPAVPVRIFENVDSALFYLTHATAKTRTIFVDLDMPEKNGWNFLDSYPSQPSDTIFILSSSDCETDMGKVKDYPMVSEFLRKPLSPEKLATVSITLNAMFGR